MANYLIQDTTLTGIAEAIRSKTGGADPIKVSDMAAKIESISGGGGAGAETSWVSASGNFTPTENGGYTVVHNLGVIPDFVMVWATKTPDTANSIVFTNGFSDAAMEAAGGASVAVCSIYSSASSSAMSFKTALSMTNVPSNYGYVKNPTKISFYVGCSEFGVVDAGTKYEWIAIGGIYGSNNQQGKYSLDAVIPEVASSYGTSVSITNNGKRLAVSGGTNDPTPLVYDLSGETPTVLDTVAVSGYRSQVDYNADDKTLFGFGRNGSTITLTKFDATSNAYNSTVAKSISGASEGGNSAFAHSPTGNGYAYAYYITATQYYGYIHTGSTLVALTVNYNTRIRHIAYSDDGAYVAMSRQGGNVEIYNATTGALIKTISTGASYAACASFSFLNKRIAVALSASPWLSVYDVESGALLYNLSDYLSSMPFTSFISLTDELAVGTTSGDVYIFDLSGDTPQKIENIPTFGGSNVYWLESSKNGEWLVIRDRTNKYIEVWSRS